MRKYSFSVDGEPVVIYPLADSDTALSRIRSSLGEGELAVLLSPTLEVDFCAVSFDKYNSSPREPRTVLAALFCFLSTVRSYPSMDVEVMLDGKIYELRLRPNEEYNFSVNCGKCKILCSKTVKFNDECDVELYYLGEKNTCAVTLTADAYLFDGERLSILLSSLFSDGVVTVAAVSYEDGLKLRCVGRSEAALLIPPLLSFLSSLGVDTSDTSVCEINRIPYRFERSGKRLCFRPCVKYLY